MQRKTSSPLWPEFTDAAILVVIAWAIAHGEARGNEGLRMDSWASNDTLIAFYRTRGFDLAGTRRIPLDSPLSEHYRGIVLALLERSMKARRSGCLFANI